MYRELAVRHPGISVVYCPELRVYKVAYLCNGKIYCNTFEQESDIPKLAEELVAESMKHTTPEPIQPLNTSNAGFELVLELYKAGAIGTSEVLRMMGEIMPKSSHKTMKKEMRGRYNNSTGAPMFWNDTSSSGTDSTSSCAVIDGGC